MQSSSGNVRLYDNLQRKFIEYLLPATITGVAGSLSDFADSIVSSNLLDSKALSIVSLGTTIAYVFSTIYVILGRGGSTIYALNLGNHERDQADKVFTVSTIISALMCFLILSVGMLFSGPLAEFLARGSGLESEFTPYLRVKILAGVPMLLLMVFTYFLTNSGHPVMTTVLTIVPNVLNLLLDFLFIGTFKMGVVGAAWASFAGFSVGVVLAVVLMLSGKTGLKFKKISFKDFAELQTIVKKGSSTGTIQAGYAIKTAFCNRVAAAYAGYLGIAAFSLCMQTLSVISIFISGALDAALPLTCAIKGFDDVKGEKYLIKTVCKIQIICSVLVVAVLEIKPELMMTIYSVKEAGAETVVIPALRLFSPMILIRWIYVFFMYLCTVSGRELYAFIISVADGFALVILFTLMLTPLIGIYGMWIAFPLTSVVILTAIYFVNRYLASKSSNKHNGFWLTPAEDNLISDITVYDKLDNIAEISKEIEQTCTEHGMDSNDAMLVAIAIEEMCVITINMSKNHDTVLLDVKITSEDDSYVVDLRSCGKPLNPGIKFDDQSRDSLEMLKKISKSLKYDYVLGINTTRVVI